MEPRDELKKLFLDVETTGTDRRDDQVIELAVIAEQGTKRFKQTWRFRPTCSIKRRAFEAHGISEAELENEPAFGEKAGSILQLVTNADVIIGYNVRFDVDFLAREFERLSVSDPFAGKRLVDPYRLWQEMEPRSLEHAYARFVGGSMEDAHSAAADIEATEAVLYGMTKVFGLESVSIDDLSNHCFPDQMKWVGPTSHFVWDNGRIMFGFGKLEEVYLFELPDTKYLDWMLKKDFPLHVRRIADEYLKFAMNEEQFSEWAEQAIGGDRAASMEADHE